MLSIIGIAFVGLSLTFCLVLADVPLEFVKMIHSHGSADMQHSDTPTSSKVEFENEKMMADHDVNYYLDGLQRGHFRKHNDDQTMSPLPPKDSFLRGRKSDKKQCHILVQKTEMQKGSCTKLADNTPACHNDQYLAINYDEC